ncbi:MAG: hypothetical protein ACD_19C00087G0002 [uncultured bacterium]|nr:MAG: hypothetical protein ACD_19C00087G0002 [uncultured bacterium]
MKIRIGKNIKQTHKKLLLLMSIHPEIEESIWIARAKLGIRPLDLPSPSRIPTKIQTEYILLVEQKQSFLKFYEIEQKYKNLEKNAGKSLSQILDEAKSDIALEIMQEENEFEEQLIKQAQEILEQHNLPGAWLTMMKTYLMTGNIYLTEVAELPVALKLERNTLKNKRLGSLAIFASDNLAGINVNISNFVYIEDLLTWIKENKKTIEALIKAFGYRKYYRPKISDDTFNEGINLYSQRKAGEKYRGIAYNKLKETGEAKDERDSTITNESYNLMRLNYQFKKTYLAKISKKSRS